MSLKLAIKLKQKVVFDPRVKNHRKWVKEYLITKSWKGCPVSFLIDSNSNNVVITVERKLLEYYTSKEFGEK